MKRIILSLSMLLMLAQNGFAASDAKFDKLIANTSSEVLKQAYRCDKATLNHPDIGDVNECLKAIELQKKNSYIGVNIAILYLNAGVLYHYSEKNYIKAYEYYMKAAKFGNTVAQSNLDILCREHSWVCK